LNERAYECSKSDSDVKPMVSERCQVAASGLGPNQEKNIGMSPWLGSIGAARTKRETKTTTTFHSKLSSKCQTVIPRELRVLLELKPGDVIRYREVEAGLAIDKLTSVEQGEDTLRAFSEWDSPTDEAAFGDL
jgi:antitoxin PrlF